MSKSLGKVARAINKSILTGSKRALSKALTKTKSKLKSDLKSDTGLSAKTLDKRINAIKPKGKILEGSVNVATKFSVQLSEFKPKEKKVKVAGKNKSGQKGRPKGKTFYGVTVKIGKEPRDIVPGGFLRTVSSGKELIFTRKDKSEYSLKEKVTSFFKGSGKYPIRTMKTDILLDSAKKRQSEAREFLKSEFDKANKAEIDTELDKNLKKLTT